MKKKILSVVLSLFMIISLLPQGISAVYAESNEEPISVENNSNISCTLAKTEYRYDGMEIYPDVKVRNGDKLLVEGEDYVLEYLDNVKPGKGTIIITFIDEYTGEITKNFTISPALISSCTVKLKKSTYTYGNKSYTPSVTVYDMYDLTVSKNNYVVEYKNNKKVGKATVTVKGKNCFTGTKTVRFNILPKVNKSSATLYLGQKYSIKTSATSKVSYKSSDSKVAKVDSKGVVTALKTGTAKITVKCNGQSSYVKITVKKPYITLPKNKNIVINSALKLSVKKSPSNVHLSWSSNNKKVATVDSKGVVKGKSKGTAKITAKFTYKGRTYKSVCTVKVTSIKKYKQGTYKIGRDMPAGEYVLYSTDDLSYFSINSDSSGTLNSIIANDLFYNTSIVRVYNGEYLELSRCYAVNIKYTSKNKNYVNGGMFKVGRDIAAGEYKLTASDDMGYYEVDSNSRHTLDNIIVNDNFYGSTYITVKNGDYLKLSGCYMSSYYG